MKLVEKISFKRSSKFISFDFPLYIFEINGFSDSLKNELVTHIDYLEKRLSEVSFSKDHGGTHTKNVLTNAHKILHFFDGENAAVKHVEQKLLDAARLYLTDVYESENQLLHKFWCNKLYHLEKLQKHQHFTFFPPPDSVCFSMHLTVSSDSRNTTNYYFLDQDISISNQDGILTVFPGCVEHDTSHNVLTSPRYTIAGDFGEDRQGNNQRLLQMQ